MSLQSTLNDILHLTEIEPIPHISQESYSIIENLLFSSFIYWPQRNLMKFIIKSKSKIEIPNINELNNSNLFCVEYTFSLPMIRAIMAARLPAMRLWLLKTAAIKASLRSP